MNEARPQSLASFWMPFTNNRDFKANPRLLVSAEGVYYKDVDGNQVSLASYKGKVVLLNFWATWCGPCKAEIPGFVRLQEKYRDQGLVIVGYSVDDTAEKAKAYAAEYKMNYPILLGEGREDVQDAYGPIWGIPASFIISKDGKVCRKHMGIAPEAVFEKEVVALLN